jgi:hypothetical protein
MQMEVLKKTVIAAFFKLSEVPRRESRLPELHFLQFFVLIFSSSALEVEKFFLQIELLGE